MLITNSRLRAFRRCPRFHQHAYVDLVRPIEQSYALRFGTLMHIGLEAWWKEPNRAMKLLRGANTILAAAEDDFDNFNVIKAQELLQGYHYRWVDSGWETILVEHEFSVPLTHPVTGEEFPARLGGKLDALASKDGRVYVVEHKTSSEQIDPGSPYWQRLTLDSQVSTYIKAAKDLGHDVVGVLYDVIQRPTIDPKKATPEDKRRYTKAGKLDARQRDRDESPEEYRQRLREDIASDPDSYYQRGTVVRTESEEREAHFDLWTWAEATLRGGYQPRNTEACKTVYGVCPYISVCSGVDSLTNTLKFRRAEVANEELSA